LIVGRILRAKFGGKLGAKNTSEDGRKSQLRRSDTRGSHYWLYKKWCFENVQDFQRIGIERKGWMLGGVEIDNGLKKSRFDIFRLIPQA